MASPVIVYIRRLEKGTNIAGRRPTPKPSLWHTNGDWSNQDLYAREIYVNTAEGKAFITNDTDIFNLARDDGQHDYVSANTLTLEDVFFHKITNVSNEIRLINNFIETYFQWRGGSSIVLEVLSGETVKHLYAANGNAKPIKLACGTDFVATQDILIQLVYDSDAEIWKEIGGTTIASVVERPWYVALKRNQPCLVSTSDGIITGFVADYLDTLTVTNKGTATPTKSLDGSYISFGSGTVFGVKIYNGATLVHEFPCNENNLNKYIVTDIITGEYYIQTGFDSIGVQDVYFPSHNYGFSIVTESVEGDTVVNYNTEKNPIFV